MTYFRGKCKDHALFCSIANVSFFCCFFSFILFNPVVHAQTVQEIENRLIGISEEWDAKEASGVAGNIQKLFVSADLEPAELDYYLDNLYKIDSKMWLVADMHEYDRNYRIEMLLYTIADALDSRDRHGNKPQDAFLLQTKELQQEWRRMIEGKFPQVSPNEIESIFSDIDKRLVAWSESPYTNFAKNKLSEKEMESLTDNIESRLDQLAERAGSIPDWRLVKEIMVEMQRVSLNAGRVAKRPAMFEPESLNLARKEFTENLESVIAHNQKVADERSRIEALNHELKPIVKDFDKEVVPELFDSDLANSELKSPSGQVFTQGGSDKNKLIVEADSSLEHTRSKLTDTRRTKYAVYFVAIGILVASVLYYRLVFKSRKVT